jgi:hypothetical protein
MIRQVRMAAIIGFARFPLSFLGRHKWAGADPNVISTV